MAMEDSDNSFSKMRNRAARNAVRPSERRTSEDQTRLAGIVRRARGTKADEMAPGVQAEAQKRFTAEQARTAGMEDFSDMADINVEAEADEMDPLKIEGVAPTKVKVTGADPAKAMAQSAPAAKTFGTQYKAMEGGKVRFSPKGDLYVYEYDPSTETYTIVDHPQGKGVGATFGADHPSIAKFDESRMAAQQESGAAEEAPAEASDTSLRYGEGTIDDVVAAGPSDGPKLRYGEGTIDDVVAAGPSAAPTRSAQGTAPARASSPKYGEGTIDDVLEAGPLVGPRYGKGTIDDVVAAGPLGEESSALSARVPEAAPLIELGLLNEAGEFDQARAAVALARRDITASQLEDAKRALRAAGIAIRSGPMGAAAARRGGLSSGML